MTQNNNQIQGFMKAGEPKNEVSADLADLSVCSTGELDITSDNIENISLQGNTLIIMLKDGSEITIEDFKAMMAASGVTELTLADGTVIDLDAIEAETVANAEDGDVIALAPNAVKEAEVVTAPSEGSLEDVIANGDAQEQSIAEEVIEQIAEVTPAAGEEVAAVPNSEAQATQGEEVANIEPASGQDLVAIAEALAAVEPAAGDTTTPLTGRGGFGFDSTTDVVSSAALDAIGPIAPTALQYNIDNTGEDLGLIEDDILAPLLNVNGGVDNAIVKEDNSIFVPITAALQGPNSELQVLTVTISGVDAATAATGGFLPTSVPGVYSQTLPAGDNYDGGVTVTPSAQSDLDLGQLGVVATSTLPGTDQIESTSDDATVITDAVADVPEVDGVDASTFINTAQDVDITGMLGADTDGSEEITGYTITSATDLSSYTFSAGTYNPAINTLTLDPSDLVGLQVTPPTDFVGSVDLEVTISNEETNLSDSEDDTSDNTNSASDTFTLTWVSGPVINYEFSTSVDGDTGLVKEDGTLQISLDVDGGDPVGPVADDEILSIVISGIDPAWDVTLPGQSGQEWVETSPSSGVFTITLPPGEDYSGVLTFEPPANSDEDHPQITITASVFDPVLNETQSDDAAVDIVTDAVADEPDVEAQDASTFKDQPLPIDITGMLGDDVDGSEEITSYEISGIPAGFSFNQGTFDAVNNVWVFTPDEIVGLEITPPSDFVGSLADLTVTVFSGETVLSDTEVDLSDNTNSASDEFTLTWVDGPVINYQFSAEVDGDTGLVKEDSSVVMTLDVENTDSVGPVAGDEILTVTISDVDPAWGFVPQGQSGASWVETSPGTWSITLPAGESLEANELTFTPPENSDTDHPELTITADMFDPALNQTESANAAADILTDAVVDTPSLSVTNASGEEGTSIALDISTAIGEASNVSESITGIAISGVPAGATLSAGTFDVTSNTWALDLADLAGLEINIPNGVTGTFDLDVTVTAEEDVASGDAANGEIDFADNITTQTRTLRLNVNADDKPLADPDPVTVDEGNTFSPSNPLTQTGDLNLTLGDDADGTTVTAKDGVVPTGLTSEGQDVTVTSDGGTFTGRDENGDIVFTAVFENSGAYTYQQFSPLDHAEGEATDDTLPIEFCVTVTDGDGDELDVDVTVNVIDANPAATNDTETVDETTGAVSGNVITNDTPGNDGFGGLTQITFEGDTFDFVDGEDTLTITGQYGDLVINRDGSYTYTLTDTNPPAGSEVFGYSYVDGDGDTASAQLTITLNIVNDQPEITITNVAVDETNLDSGNLTRVGTITADFGADGPGTLVASGSGPSGLTSGGQTVTVTNTDSVYTGTNENNDIVFTLTLNGDGSYTYEQSLPLDHPDTTDGNDAIELDFGVTATDDDSESETGTITVTVRDDGVTANDDFNRFDSNDGSTSGNVIIGDNGPFDTTDADVDDLSNDTDNTVVNVRFDGTDYEVSVTEPTIVSGEFGALTISSDGSYTYELFDPSQIGQMLCDVLDPVASDVAGNQTSFTKNDITVRIGQPQPGSSVSVGGDLKFINSVEGIGIGIGDNGNGDNKVWPRGETLEIDPVTDAVSLSITLSEISPNNAGNPLSVNVSYTDGSSETLTFNAPNPAPADGLWTFDVNGGDKQIDSVGLFNQPGAGAVSFLLSNVKSYYPVPAGQDEFEYTLRDGDGDTNTAILTFIPEDLINDQPTLEVTNVAVEEQNLNAGDLVQNGTFTAEFGADGPGTVRTNGSAPSGLTSAGQAITVSNTNNGYTGTRADGETVFTLILNGNGTYTYTQSLGLDHPDTNSSDEDIVLEFGITAQDSDVDTATASIFVTVTDDGPVANYDYNVLAVDARSGDGNVITGRNGGFNAADDLSNDAPNIVTSIRHEGVEYEVLSGEATIVNAAYGVLRINQNGEYIYTLNSDVVAGSDYQVRNDYFYYTLQDADGDTDEAKLNIQSEFNAVVAIAPEAQDDDCTIYVPNGEFSSNVLSNDNDNGQDGVRISRISFDGNDVDIAIGSAQVINGDYGTLSIAPNGNYTYTVTDPSAAPAVEVFTYTLIDSDGDTSTANLDVNLIGADLQGTENNDVLTGGTGDEVIYANGGNDQIDGEAGDDKIFGGDGDDRLYGWLGDDEIDGGDGDDIMGGEWGVDTLIGGAGADQFVLYNIEHEIDVIKDFDLSEGDALNFSTMFDTTYDPAQDAISDFVFVTGDGAGNTDVSYDLLGRGDAGLATKIATLEGVGLDINQLEAQNGIIV